MKKLNMMLVLAFMNMVAFAQEKAVDANVDVNLNSGSEVSSFPWMYVIGAVLLIVLLFALLGGRGRDRTIERRTVVKE